MDRVRVFILNTLFDFGLVVSPALLALPGAATASCRQPASIGITGNHPNRYQEFSDGWKTAHLRARLGAFTEDWDSLKSPTTIETMRPIRPTLKRGDVILVLFPGSSHFAERGCARSVSRSACPET
jgi:hypothetical protein